MVESCPSLSCSASCLIPNSCIASAPITLSHLPSPPLPSAAASSMIISGIGVLLIWLLPPVEYITVLLSCIFSGFAIIGWNALDVLSIEYFPTHLRYTCISKPCLCALVRARGTCGIRSLYSTGTCLMGPLCVRQIRMYLFKETTVTQLHMCGSPINPYYTVHANATDPD